MSDPKKPKHTRPTMQAIADRAGVSRATVSLILTNRQEIVERFKPETVAKVREIAEEMGYQANIMALSLRAPHPSFYGLILRGSGVADAISWHHQAFEGQFLAGALEASRLLGLYPVLATQDSPDPEAALKRVRGVLDGGVFGAILRTPRPVLAEAVRRQIDQCLPVVVVFPEDHTNFPTNAIDVDNVAAGKVAAQLLRAADRHKLLLIQDEMTWEAIRLRNEGFLTVAQGAGADVRVLTVPGGMNGEQIEAWLATQLKDIRPDGVYTASSVTGVEAMMACQAAGLRVPEEASLVGSDAALWRAPGCPAITSVDVSWYKVGELAVNKMAELQEKEQWTFENLNLPPCIRVGGTCPVGTSAGAEVVLLEA
ncbi:MAG: LacI family DNA-binding transcriptional regulator [Planctomycetes bacterium]|nr:LacI family DNA-binding transcriptional regulator [Planctomycetota bacterium]